MKFYDYINEAKMKQVTLSMQDKIEQNKKHNDGKGTAKIDDTVWEWANKKFTGSGTYTITKQSVAERKNSISINTKNNKITIKPVGDYIMVKTTKGTNTDTKFYKP